MVFLPPFLFSILNDLPHVQGSVTFINILFLYDGSQKDIKRFC